MALKPNKWDTHNPVNELWPSLEEEHEVHIYNNKLNTMCLSIHNNYNHSLAFKYQTHHPIVELPHWW